MEVLKSIALMGLLVWHCHLSRVGVTTYQYLVEKEQIQKLDKEL